MVYTVEDIMSCNPCYPYMDVVTLIGEGKTIEEILDLPIPPKDLIWLCSQLLEREVLMAWATRIMVLEIDEPDSEWERQFVTGEDRSYSAAAKDCQYAWMYAARGHFYSFCLAVYMPFEQQLQEMKECLRQQPV